MAKTKFQIPTDILWLFQEGRLLEKRTSTRVNRGASSTWSLVTAEGRNTHNIGGVLAGKISRHTDMKPLKREHHGLFYTEKFEYVGTFDALARLGEEEAPAKEAEDLRSEQARHVQELVEGINLLKQADKWLSAASEKNVRLSADIHTRIELQTAHHDSMWIRLTDEILPLAMAATQTQTAGDAKTIVAIGQIKIMVSISAL